MSSSLLGLPPTTSDLKSLVPFLQRADEVKQQHPIVAYWCGYYAAQQGIASQSKDPQSRQFLFALVDLLERMKREIGPTDAIDNQTASCAYLENFALRVFSLADNEDRNGNATRATARKFLVAANFLEVLNVFPKTEVSDSIDEKVRYAKWKAADIAKALREGRKLTPGPAAPSILKADPSATSVPEYQNSEIPMTEETDVSVIDKTTEAKVIDYLPRNAWVSDELEGQPGPIPETSPPESPMHLGVGITPATPSFPFEVDPSENMTATEPATEFEHQPMPQFLQSPYPPWPLPSTPSHLPSTGGYETIPALPTVPRPPPPPPPPPPAPVPAPSIPASQELAPSMVVKVQKHCRFAISALDYEDVEQAKKELRAALVLLGE